MNTLHRLPIVIGTVLVAALATGCSELPTQPQVEAGGATAMTMSQGGATASMIRQPGSGPQNPPPGQARILGRKGGSVTNGVFTVVFPPGAISGQAYVTITQPDPTQPLVELNITPASKNRFHKAVTLIALLPNVDSAAISASTVSELDATAGTWSLVSGSTTDPMARTVSAPLAHFSTYRVDVPPTVNGTPRGVPNGGD